MSRIQPVKVEDTTGKTKELLGAVEKSLGSVPNLFRVVANSPAALDGFLSFSRALKASKLTAKQREQLALVVANDNGCNYCISAHSVLGKLVGLTEEQLEKSAEGRSEDEKTQALLQLARALVRSKGEVSQAEYQQAVEAGITEAEAIEVVAVVAENIFTNYINNFAQTAIDFPLPKALQKPSCQQ